MLDLIGFWTVVTLVTFSLIGVWFKLAGVVSAHLALKITNESHIAYRVKSWFGEWETRSTTKFFGKYVVDDMLYGPAWFLGGVAQVFYAICFIVAKCHGQEVWSVVALVARLAEVTAPYMAWVGIVGGGYIAIVVIGKKLYKSWIVLDKVIRKVNDE